MALQVIDNYIDAAGWRRVRIQNDVTGECALFKFPAALPLAEVRLRVQAWLNDEIARRQAEGTERTRVSAITTAVGQYIQGALTTPQQATLLAALAKEWRG